MTGRALYDKYCDVTAKAYSVHRGAWSPADTPLPAWPSLSSSGRSRWNDLARVLSPKPKKR